MVLYVSSSPLQLVLGRFQTGKTSFSAKPSSKKPPNLERGHTSPNFPRTALLPEKPPPLIDSSDGPSPRRIPPIRLPTRSGHRNQRKSAILKPMTHLSPRGKEREGTLPHASLRGSSVITLHRKKHCGENTIGDFQRDRIFPHTRTPPTNSKNLGPSVKSCRRGTLLLEIPPQCSRFYQQGEAR